MHFGIEGAALLSEGDFDPKPKLIMMNGESLGADGKPEKFKRTTKTKSEDDFAF